MKIQQKLLAAALMFVSVFAATGIASAAEEEEMTAQQNCEQEAKQAGMTEEQDIQEYVAQCLAEAAQKNSAPEAESGT